MNEAPNRPLRFRDSWLIRVGVALLVVGTGPLVGILAAAKLGLTKDPNPNPIGPGMLAGLSFMPGVALILAGAVSVLWSERQE